MFSDILSFLSSSRVNDQVSHPYKTTGKIIGLYILIFKFLFYNKFIKYFYMSSLNLCTGRPPTGVMIPDAV